MPKKSVPLTSAQRSMRGRMAAHARWSGDRNRKANAERAQRGLLARFEREVDPDGELDEGERRKLAENARQAHMTKLAYQSSRARSRRGEGQAD